MVEYIPGGMDIHGGQTKGENGGGKRDETFFSAL
jgi:hypothetical protein